MLSEGTWYQSAVSGLWYQDPKAAGDIRATSIDGVIYLPADTADSANIRHLEECPGCPECDSLLEFYMACDGCGSWGHKSSDGFTLYEDESNKILFLCDHCYAQKGE